MSTLSSCPFCEGEARLKEYKPAVSGVAICTGCGARSPICRGDHAGGWKAHAIEAWNRRAERTCSPVFGECSECKYPLHDHARYCSNCGARIKAVDE